MEVESGVVAEIGTGNEGNRIGIFEQSTQFSLTCSVIGHGYFSVKKTGI